MKRIIFKITLSFFMLTNISLFAQNNSLDFDGTDDKVVITNNAILNPTDAITIEAWINASTWKPQSWQGTIVGKDGDSGGSPSGYVLRAGANGTLSFVLTPNWQEITSSPIMETNRWYHVAGTFDGNTMKIYINGELQASSSKNTPIRTSPFNLNIGESGNFAGRVFNGKIDEVRIWNICRTQQEINANMKNEISGSENGLVAYYKLNDGNSSTTASDATSYGNNGTLTNMNSSTDWVAGFVPPQNDAGIIAILNPTSGPDWADASRLKIEIKNFGFNSINNITVGYIYNGIIHTENIFDTIKPSETYTHIFNSFINLSHSTTAKIKAFTSLSGDLFNNNDTTTINITKSNTVVIFNKKQHNFANAGQLQKTLICLPENIDSLSQILLHIKLECPSNGCDPWDQPAKITLVKNNHQYEIGRYITPYKKACGPWTVDVTDFKSLLKGKCEFWSYIQVWGSSGWLATISLEFIKGTPQYNFSKITPLWETDYWVYGDTAISYDFPADTILIENNTQSAVVRMTNTGHGQANTDNAAEFSPKTHHLFVNGVESFDHYLWKSNCNTNSCSPQNGTWQYARAGWCPGQEVTPVWFNLQSQLNPGNNIVLDYVLQDYTNFLNTGYNGSSHTEPYYRLHSFLVESSNTSFTEFSDAELTSIISPVNGNTNPSNNENVIINIKNIGTKPISNYQVNYLINDTGKVTETIADTLFPEQNRNYTFSHTANLAQMADGELVAFVNAKDDYNCNNDAKRVGFGIYYEINNEPLKNLNIIVYPNPTDDIIHLSCSNCNTNSNIEISDVTGRLLLSKNFNSNKNIDVSMLNNGIYLIKIKDNNNYIIKKMLISR